MTATTTSQDKGPRGTVDSNRAMGVLFGLGLFIGVVNAPVAFIAQRYLEQQNVQHAGAIGLAIAGVTAALGAVLHQFVYQESPERLQDSGIVKWLKDGEVMGKKVMSEKVWNFIFDPKGEAKQGASIS